MCGIFLSTFIFCGYACWWTLTQLHLGRLPSLWQFGVSMATMKWWHDDIFEALDHHWLLPTFIFDVWKVFEHHHLLLIGIWVHPPYTVTLIKLAKILVIYGQCGYEMMAWWHCWGCRPLLTASHILIGCIEFFWAPLYAVDMHIGGPLYCHTWGGCPDYGNSGSTWLQLNDGMMTLLRL